MENGWPVGQCCLKWPTHQWSSSRGSGSRSWSRGQNYTVVFVTDFTCSALHDGIFLNPLQCHYLYA